MINDLNHPEVYNLRFQGQSGITELLVKLVGHNLSDASDTELSITGGYKYKLWLESTLTQTLYNKLS